MKALKPTMRENKRYILIEGKIPRGIIENAILDFSGILGMSKTGLSFIKSDDKNTIISINREFLDELRASLCLAKCEIKIKKVSGTIKGLG